MTDTNPGQFTDPLIETNVWIQKCLPNPQDKDFHTQFGVFCEEVTETLQELSVTNTETLLLLDSAKKAMHQLAQHLRANLAAFSCKKATVNSSLMACAM